jgi:hypothetical protein
LLQDKFWGRGINAQDAPGILRREAGNDGRSVDAERRESLEVSLDAGAAAAVRAGDGKRTIEF